MGNDNRRPQDDSGLDLDWQGRTTPEQRTQDTALAAVGAGRGAPGDSRHMSPELRHELAPLLEGDGFGVRQIHEWGEILVGWETRNRYEASGSDGNFMLYIGETGEGWGNALLRNLWPFRRVEMECMTKGGTLALSLQRPWTFFFTRVEVKAWDGRLLGTIEQRFSILRRSFELCSPGGAVMATLEGPLWRPWTFFVKQRGEEVATIRKQWSGLLREAFTDSDFFGVEFHPGLTDARLRQMVLAATLMVDLCYFENRSNSSPLGWLSDLFDFD